MIAIYFMLSCMTYVDYMFQSHRSKKHKIISIYIYTVIYTHIHTHAIDLNYRPYRPYASTGFDSSSRPEGCTVAGAVLAGNAHLLGSLGHGLEDLEAALGAVGKP